MRTVTLRGRTSLASVEKRPEALLEALERLAPGTRLRRSLERVIQHGNGALVVLGDGPQVDAICTGGFELRESDFTSARLAELAKMDGAIVLSDDCTRILRANVHLLPDPTLATDETGARHRTAERVARQTGKPVAAVSEDRGVVTLFLNGGKHELESPTALVARVNQSLQTLDRLRRRLDDAERRLTRLEVADVMSYRSVIAVLQRAELVLRISKEVEGNLVSLGGESDLIDLQLADLRHGVQDLRGLVLRDYVRPARRSAYEKAVAAIEGVSTADLNDPQQVAMALGFDHPDAEARPFGYRIVSQIPRLPDNVQDRLVRHFRDFHSLLVASVDQLDRVEGVGRARAAQIRHHFDRLIESTRRIDPDDAAGA